MIGFSLVISMLAEINCDININIRFLFQGVQSAVTQHKYCLGQLRNIYEQSFLY